jgi:murein L,D-transpeptidase YcbB/YkuD
MKYFLALKQNWIIFVAAPVLMLMHACSSSDHSTVVKQKGIAASSNIDLNVLNKQLAERFDSSNQVAFLPWENDTVDKLPLYKQVYKQKTSLWFDESGINPAGADLLVALDDLKNDGLDINRYKLTDLKALRKEIQEKATERIVFDFETKLTAAFLTASKDMLTGSRPNLNKEIKNPNDSLVNEADVLTLAVKNGDFREAFEMMRPRHPWYHKFRDEYVKLNQMKLQDNLQNITGLHDSLHLGDSSAQIPLLRKKLFRAVKSPADTQSAVWDVAVLESLKKFQHLHQLKVSGVPDTATLNKLNQSIDSKLSTLALNMERMRWLRHDFKQPYIWVDIPKMEMDYIDHDSIEFNMRVVVGRPSRATPALDARIENVVLSPPWNVPPTIMREEVVPGIARRGGAYLSRRGLRAYDRRGRPVSASAINAGNYRNFSIGQAPGYRSSLGEVKFNMPNPWAIYMHDTPHREDFVKFYRAYSSGCVRVHKPKEFATFLLRDSLRYSYAKIDSICKLRKTIFVPVNRNIDVHFVYLTNALDSAGNVMFLKDIYGWD